MALPSLELTGGLLFVTLVLSLLEYAVLGYLATKGIRIWRRRRGGRVHGTPARAAGPAGERP